MQLRASPIIPKAQLSPRGLRAPGTDESTWAGESRPGSAIAVAIRTSVVLLSSLLTILLTQSVAGARDFSPQTANPRGSYSSVRMQQGKPQLDNDRKRDFGGPSVKIESHSGSVDMQQGKILRDNDWVDADKRGKHSIIFCGTNCRK
jgi:hypothetical protein